MLGDLLMVGDEGPQVVELQSALRGLGLAANVSGKFDRSTDLAVRTQQSRSGLPATGIVDSKTREGISKALRQKTELTPAAKATLQPVLQLQRDESTSSAASAPVPKVPTSSATLDDIARTRGTRAASTPVNTTPPSQPTMHRVDQPTASDFTPVEQTTQAMQTTAQPEPQSIFEKPALLVVLGLAAIGVMVWTKNMRALGSPIEDSPDDFADDDEE